MTRTKEITMPNGNTATVEVRQARFGYSAWLICASTVARLPCSFGCEPLGIDDALDLAVTFVRRACRGSICA